MNSIPGIGPYVENNFGSIKNFQCITTNTLFEVFSRNLSTAKLSASLIWSKTVLSNLPLRAWNCFLSYKKRDYVKIAFDASAVMSLFFFPNEGRKIAIFIDLTSEILPRLFSNIGFCLGNPTLDNNKEANLDYTVYENALQFLNISKTESNPEILEQKYKSLTEAYQSRIKKLEEIGSSLSENIKKLLEDTNTSYKTVLKTLTSKEKKPN